MNISTNDRYMRQIILPEIGQSGQQRLKKAKILCVGAGGLGSPICLYLAACGIGTLGIIDHDIVDITNLQRQILFKTTDQGMAKVTAAQQHLSALNPDIEIITHPVRLDHTNALEIMANYDIIIDGCDNFATKYLINDAAVKMGKPVVYGAISGFEGQAATFWADHGPCYRCLYPSAPKGHIANCAEAGVIGAVAGLIGSVQALEAIKLIVNPEGDHLSPLLGWLWVCDMRTMTTQRLSLSKRTDCPVCSIEPFLVELPTVQNTCHLSNNTESIPAVQPDDLSDMNCTLIDVRTLSEYQNGHLPGAANIPLDHLLTSKDATQQLHQQQVIVVYCQRGIRSLQAALFLKDHGFTVMHLPGGLEQHPSLQLI